mgnify:CR=1 FL=1
MMTGEPVNISNIEKKIKDGFDNVSETVTGVAKNVGDSVSGAARNMSDAAKNVDFQKQGNKIKSSSKTFFDTVGEVFMFFFKVFAKFIGIILIIIGAAALISLIIGLFSLGVADIVHIPGLDLVDIVNAGNTPVWLVSLLTFFTVGIPFFFLFYLGLKILINNLKSIGNVAKFTLLGLWLISIIGLVIIGIREASEHAYEESYIEKTELPITTSDTLHIKMVNNDNYSSSYFKHHNGFKLVTNEDGDKILYSRDIDIIVRSTTDSVATLSVDKSADGSSYDKAIERAKKINYNFELNGNILFLDSYLTTNPSNKYSDQEVDIILYLPENTIIKLNSNTKSYLSNRKYTSNIISVREANHYIKILEDDIECLDCPIEDEDFKVEVNTPGLKIDDNGVEIKSDDTNLKIDETGLKAESDAIKVNIDSNGINIQTD